MTSTDTPLPPVPGLRGFDVEGRPFWERDAVDERFEDLVDRIRRATDSAGGSGSSACRLLVDAVFDIAQHEDLMPWFGEVVAHMVEIHEREQQRVAALDATGWRRPD